MSAALFDLDAFSHVNERYGALVCDKILYQIGQVIQGKAGEADLAGRYAGAQFLLVILDLGPRKAIKSAEFIRQSIERITFLSGDDEIRVTVGGGITEVVPDDTHEALFTRSGTGTPRGQGRPGRTGSLPATTDGEPSW